MRRLTGDPVLSEKIVQYYRRAGLDQKTRAMLDYAIKITRTPMDCDERDIERLQELGFSLDDVYDIITTASIYNYNNRVAEAAGHLPDRKNHGLFRWAVVCPWRRLLRLSDGMDTELLRISKRG